MSSIKEKQALQDKEYWRSLNELADTDRFRDFLEHEFPEGADEAPDSMSRRTFVKIMGASVAMATLIGCRKPMEKIVPYLSAPEERVLGKPEYYATTMQLGLNAYGLLVESHEGRPTKVEGNDLHRSNRGGTNTFMQGAILSLYDPDRSKFHLHNGVSSSWAEFVEAWRSLFTSYSENDGEGLAVLSASLISPTMNRLRKEFLKTFPKAKWVAYDPVHEENRVKGLEIAYGEKLLGENHFEKADIVLSLDSDFMRMELDDVSNAKGYAERRSVKTSHDTMNRLYVAEGVFSLTGTNADHRLKIHSSEIGAFTIAVAHELGKHGVEVPGVSGVSANAFEFDKKWISALAKDLVKHKGKSLVVAGARQPAEVHALVASINEALGNAGQTVSYHKADDLTLSNSEDLSSLVADMKSGKVETLALFGTNPLYDTPRKLDFKSALKKVKNSISFNDFADESASECNWHVPRAHFMESWGDARAIDGSLSIVQPLIRPLYSGHMDVEFAKLLASGEDVRGYDIVRESWTNILNVDMLGTEWDRTLHDGVLINSGSSGSSPRLNAGGIRSSLNSLIKVAAVSRDSMEVVFYPSYSTFDGRYANVGWLQELPDPVTKVVWDNPVVMSPETAKHFKVGIGDMVEIEFQGNKLPIPVYVMPGWIDNCLGLELGYARQAKMRVGGDVGFNTYLLRDSNVSFIGTGAKIRKIGGSYLIAQTQEHGAMEGRPILREATLEEYSHGPHFFPKETIPPHKNSLWEDHKYDTGYQWGMTIDLNSCIGCNACAVACMSENNIPLVGKEQVANGREMNWIRIDRYFVSDVEHPKVAHQPVPCMHCEMAPCEQVCPVAATVHDAEGLNVMTYNRCIGTRYCSNNCPYKVRRFNFFNYTKETPEIVKMAMNPEVTVRSRGVMEKCSYCNQRINRARQEAKQEGREIRDGDVITACQQGCPTNAISFGNINDPHSEISQMKSSDRNYSLLGELNTRPRTTYLAKLRNPNPEIEPPQDRMPKEEHNGTHGSNGHNGAGGHH
ncbi:TAT-variant-translocated molybdopterin oxidoreductase [bacterium]|nr:TAT-variant-translocated molybdopterin oxidoreductase [bacterium]